MAGIVSSKRLDWHSAANRALSLHLDNSGKALLHVVPDKTYDGMWRIRFGDGSLSDMANLTRAKDAAITHGLSIVNSNAKNAIL